MTRKPILSAAAALLAGAVLAAGAVAPAQANDPARQELPAKAESRKYCLQTETTGSKIAKLECRTRDQWIAERNIDPVELMKKR